jgi:hypothetical protein
MLNTAPWNRQAACEKCSRRKSSQEGHYLAGHDVPRPYDLAIIPAYVLAGRPAPPMIPRSITVRYDTDAG